MSISFIMDLKGLIERVFQSLITLDLGFIEKDILL